MRLKNILSIQFDQYEIRNMKLLILIIRQQNTENPAILFAGFFFSQSEKV